MGYSRRNFLEIAALGSTAQLTNAADNEKPKLPSRLLGRTGERVSILAFGGGSRLQMFGDEEKALEAVDRALKLGITYIDTAPMYGNGGSEQHIGKVLKAGHYPVFLATKMSSRKADEARQGVEQSLKRLNRDRLDLLHIHTLRGEDDLAQIEAKGGALELLYKLRDEKITRFIGITSHTDPAVLKKALERHDFDCTQMALNAGLAAMDPPLQPGSGMRLHPLQRQSFENIALPVAVRKKMGIIAMKVFAQGRIMDGASVDQILRYGMSLPVNTAVVGMGSIDEIEQNVRIARDFRPMSPSEMRELSGRLSAKYSAELDRFFRHHEDA